MRIISPFKDFYDNAMAFGQDEAITYARSPEVRHGPVAGITFPWEEEKRSFHVLAQPTSNGIYFRDYVELYAAFLFIAGQAELVWVPHFRANEKLEDVRVLRGLPDHEAWLDEFYNAGKFYGKARHELTIAGGWRYDEHVAPYNAFIKRTDLNAVHFAVNAPVVLALPRHVFEGSGRAGRDSIQTTLVTNLPLTSFHVEKRRHAFDAFQAISQFVEGVLPSASAPTYELSDEEQVRKKGFDPEYGFRQTPGKIKRAKHRKNKNEGEGQAQ